MDRIQGKHPFKGSWTLPEKKIILQNIVNSLKTLHGLNKQPSSNQDIKTVYLDKTIERVNKVKQLIPFFNNASLKINGNLYTNPFWASTNYLEDYIKEIKINHFCPIHGDCTFSNILIDKDLTPWFIDPRGYFAKTSFYGDEQYDWAKLYYSLVGNYDSINNKAYTLNITSHGVSYSIKDNGWSILENYFFDISEQNKNNIQLLHALIWFALCGYVVEDYDAILISFYNGVILWNQYVESL
jgi:thiamine kinase-like enzyme